MSGIVAAVTGRAGRDAERKTAQSGAGYAVASVAVDVAERRRGDQGDQDEREPALWVRVKAFGRTADALAVVRKGETVHASGRLERGRYTARDGTERESWSLLADTVIAARPAASGPARPTGRREPEPMDDGDIPF